jgi:hypothetical protein
MYIQCNSRVHGVNARVDVHGADVVRTHPAIGRGAQMSDTANDTADRRNRPGVSQGVERRAPMQYEDNSENASRASGRILRTMGYRGPCLAPETRVIR